MSVQFFQTRLVRVSPTEFRPVRVGPHYVSIQAPPRAEQGLPATEYEFFDVAVPPVAYAHVWAKWANAHGPVEIPMRRSVSPEQVQELLDWLRDGPYHY